LLNKCTFRPNLAQRMKKIRSQTKFEYRKVVRIDPIQHRLLNSARNGEKRRFFDQKRSAKKKRILRLGPDRSLQDGRVQAFLPRGGNEGEKEVLDDQLPPKKSLVSKLYEESYKKYQKKLLKRQKKQNRSKRSTFRPKSAVRSGKGQKYPGSGFLAQTAPARKFGQVL
jgi:hypothetical protein